MAKVILICGKICSGKSRYARQLQQQENAVILSCDEISCGIFDGNLGDRHDEMMVKIKAYLREKSLEIVRAGTNVILEWGFWVKADREDISRYYREQGITFEWHCVDISDESWQRNIRLRNQAVAAGETTDYAVDAGLLEKLDSLFQKPEREEMDVWYQNQ